MPRIVITGGPGAGKTTLLRELALLGHRTVAESAREVIAERQARGASPRPAPLAFAREILRRDTLNYEREQGDSGWVFFDRGALESVGMLHEAAPLAEPELQAMLARYAYGTPVFVLPPWEAIYTTDAQRDQSYAESVCVHASIVRWYRRCGYPMHEVAPAPVHERARQVLGVLARRRRERRHGLADLPRGAVP